MTETFHSRDDDLVARAAEQVRAARENARKAGITSTPLAAPIDEPHESPVLASDSILGYEIVAERYRGGQGVVFEAVQQTTRRRVAIKVLHEVPRRLAAVRARFEREVQVLAQLRHPNIVTIHESSDSTGRCYYVMDYVDGLPLDRWLAQQFTATTRWTAPLSGSRGSHTTSRADERGSSVGTLVQPGSSSVRPGGWSHRDTLRLFTKICDAVQAAHVRGVIHRDLKPNNVLVDAACEPRVVDFGLAKITHDSDSVFGGAGDLTASGQFVGSLPWSSPEQIEGSQDNVDMRSDVYSLGVMLFHALTAQFPYPLQVPMVEAIENIRSREPAVPSRLVRGLNDDIDTIILKCLQKDPARRYQTAGELGRDIERYLAGHALEAKRDSTVYVLGKYLRRYRLPIGVAGTFMLLVLVGGLTATALWRQASHDRDLAGAAQTRADRRFNELRTLARTFIYDLDDKLKDLPGSTPTRLFIVETARHYLDALAADPNADPELIRETAQAYVRIGHVLGRPLHANLGKYDTAAEMLERARELYQQLTSSEPGDWRSKRGLAEISNTLGDIHRVGRRLDDAAREYERYHAIASEVADGTNAPRDRRDVAIALLGLSDLAVARNQPDLAANHIQDAIRILEALPDDAEYTQDLRRDRSIAYTRLGDRHSANKDHVSAQTWYRKSLTIDEARLAAAPDSATTRRDVTVDLLRVGETLIPEGRFDEALPLMERAIEMRETAVRDDPLNAQALRDLATANYTLAQLFDARANAPGATDKLHSFERALAALRRAYELWETMRDRGVLRSSDLGSGQELSTNIALTEDEIARLRESDGNRETPQSQPSEPQADPK